MSMAKFETVVEYRRDRQARERKEWIADAVAYMISIGFYAQEEVYEALYLAELLHAEHVDAGGDVLESAKDAIDEELTYWGD